MSIIQEALKKGQSVFEDGRSSGAHDVNEKETVRPVSEISPGNIGSPKRPVFLTGAGSKFAAIFLLAFVALLAVAVKQLFRHERPTLPERAALHQDVTYKPISDIPQNTEERQPLPSRPIPRMSAPMPNLVLNGIMYLEDGPRAIINNSIVGVGDSVSSASVARITRSSVVLESDSAEITLNLK